MNLVSILAALVPFLPADALVDELRGFRIDVPDGWTTNEQDGGERFTLQLLPPGSIGQRGVTVTVQSAAAFGSVADVMTLAREKVAGEQKDVVRDFEELERELAGRTAPGLRAIYDSGAGDYRLQQSFLIEAGRLYTLQSHAPVEEYEDVAAEYADVLATFDFVAPTAASAEEALLIELAERCGSEVAWAATWDEAAARARAEKKPVLVAAFMIPGFAIHDTPRNSTFMDPDVIELVNARYVPFWYERGMDAAFVDTYGLGASAFGQALLVVTPDGDVVHETHAASSPEVALPFLVAALELTPKLTGAPIDRGVRGLERAALHVARGEYAAAREALDGDDSAEAHLVRMDVARREQRGAEALQALADARAAGAETTPALQVVEGQLRLRVGEDAAGRALLERVAADHPATEAGREARLLLGLLDLPEGREDTRARWRALALEAPDSRWSWLAASALRSTILEVDVKPGLTWPAPAAVEELLRRNTPTPLPVSRASRAADGAAAWLIANQGEDGAWAGANELSDLEGMGPDPFVDATAALAGSALLRDAGSAEATAAAQRTLAFLIESVARREAEPPLVLFMDYMTWSDSMILRFFADALDRGITDVDGLAATVNVIVGDMAARQQTGGGWSYYVTSDIGGSGAPANSISFTTAAAVLALARARAAGFRISDEVLDPGVDALERMRLEDGTFAYFLFHGSGPQTGTPVEGAVGRGPACELALYAVGKSDKQRVGAALERFLELRHLFAPEQGKVVMHAGPHAQGCHYLLFDYAHAAFALQELEPDRGARTKLLELVLACRQPDGSFLDTPILGRPYGTAMALLALDALAK